MRITVVEGDITEQQVDVIVNAANRGLLGGGGVDGAIHRRGGPAIRADCERLRRARFPDGLPVGQAVATGAGALPARWVVHVVGPVYGSGGPELLASCYRQALGVADELAARTIAFPAVSAGAFGWPLDDAARIAVQTVRVTPTGVAEARFVLFGADAYAAFSRALGETDVP